MREFLTGLGILVCLLLAAAMAGPHFVDWGSYRKTFETEISKATGLPTVIEGPIALTLLPTPSLSLEQVRIGTADAKGFRPLEAERIAGALAAMPLLRGDFQVTEAYIDGLVVRIGADGMAGLPAKGAVSGVHTDAVSIERLLIRDGSALIERPGGPARNIAQINAEIEATSLAGPAKGSGSFVLDGANRNFRFSLGRIENGRSRIKALIEDVALAMRFDVDGVAGLSGGRLDDFEGTLAFSGNPEFGDQPRGTQIPVRAAAKAKLAGQALDLREISLSIGADSQPFTLQGEGKVQLGDQPHYDLSLFARSFDFDRPGPDGQPRTMVPSDGLRQLAGLFPSKGEGSLWPGRIAISAGGVIVGGQTIIGAGGVLESSAQGPKVMAFEGEFPGQTRLKFERAAGTDGLLAGRLDVESRDPERFNGWFLGVPLVATSNVSLKASARIGPLKDGVQLDDIVLARGETRLSGAGSFLLAAPGTRPAPRLTLKLRTPKLNVADIPALATRGEEREEKPELDYDVDVDAARLVFEDRETGRLVARLRRDGAIVSIERVSVTDFEGASLIVSGTLGGGSRRLTFKLEADRLEGMTALGERLLPSALTTSLRKRARLMAPALVVASLADEENGSTYAINADGKLAGTAIKAEGRLTGKNDMHLDLTLSLDNPNGSALARQISASPAPPVAATRGGIVLTMKGNPRGALATDVDGRFAGLEARVSGQIKVFQPFAPFEGVLNAKSTDLAPVLAAAGIELPTVVPGTPGQVSGRVESNLERILITDMKAAFGGSTVSGEIAFNIKEAGKVSGQLRTPSLDLRPILSIALGAPRGFLGAGVWSNEPFGRPLTPALTGDLWIEADKARLDDATQFDASKFVLRFDAGATSIEYSDILYGGARLSGDVFLRRNGPAGFVSARIKAGDVRAEALSPEGAKGRIDGEFQLSGSGASPAQVVASLAGNGSVRVKGATIPSFEPDALDRLLSVPLQNIGPLDRANLTKRLENELERGDWSAQEATLPIVVINGVGRIGAVSFEQPRIRHDVSGTVDINTLGVDFRMAATALQPPADWRGAQPQYIATWRGPLTAPKRSVSVDSLVNGYLALALARDMDKADQIEQDIRERSSFNRRLRAAEQEKKRAEEERLADEARLQDEMKAAKEKAADEERQRRIQQIIQQGETTAAPRPPAAPVTPRRAAPVLAPPMDLTTPGRVRPPAAPPVDVRPLDPPER